MEPKKPVISNEEVDALADKGADFLTQDDIDSLVDWVIYTSEIVEEERALDLYGAQDPTLDLDTCDILESTQDLIPTPPIISESTSYGDHDRSPAWKSVETSFYTSIIFPNSIEDEDTEDFS